MSLFLVRNHYFGLVESFVSAFLLCFWIFSINAIDPKTKKILQLLRLRQVTHYFIDFILQTMNLDNFFKRIFVRLVSILSHK